MWSDNVDEASYSSVFFFTFFLPVSFDRYIIGTNFLILLIWGEGVTTWCVYIIGIMQSSSRLIQLNYCKACIIVPLGCVYCKTNEVIFTRHGSQFNLSRRYQIVALATKLVTLISTLSFSWPLFPSFLSWPIQTKTTHAPVRKYCS